MKQLAVEDVTQQYGVHLPEELPGTLHQGYLLCGHHFNKVNVGRVVRLRHIYLCEASEFPVEASGFDDFPQLSNL